MDFVKRSSLQSNPLVANIDISVSATDWLWAVFAVMLTSAIGLLILGGTRPVGQRAFHHLAAIICFTASIAYFSMASDLGATPIEVEFIRGGTLGRNWVQVGVPNPTRSIWYARYIDWVITTPLLLLELLLATGLPLSEIFTTIFFDEVMIITGLIGALVSSQYKWGFFTFGCVAEFYIWWVLLGPARKSAGLLGSEFQKSYQVSAIILSTLWLLYPVAWGVADGGNVITPTSEMIFYGILDLLAKPVFCFAHCLQISKLEYARLGFQSGKFSEGANDYHSGNHSNDTVGRRNSENATLNSGGNAVPVTKEVHHTTSPATTTPVTGGGLHSTHAETTV